MWPFLRGRPRVRISPVSLAPKPGDFCLIFDAILTPKTNYGPITLTRSGWGYLKWPQLPGASLRAAISGAGRGQGLGVPLAWGCPCCPVCQGRGGIPSSPIPSCPVLSLLHLWAPQRPGRGGAPCPCRVRGASPSPVSPAGASPEGPVTGGAALALAVTFGTTSSESRPGLGTGCASHSKLGHFCVHPERHGTASSR